MSRLSLQEIIEDIPFDNLPANWNTFDLQSFSKSKILWDYQQRAVTNAIKTLWKYYDDFVEYSPKERPEVNNQRKQKFAQWYRDNGQDDNLDIQLSNDYKHAALLGDYYRIGSDDTLSYEQFLNRACSWMATGSGKTLVIIKLIEILQQLIKRG
ncbi:MAG: DEAD/DEAH box helicase family protein [Nitrospirae bacterium]|nr:DEAD/DEAH box helicase family protein [Nitrospirota bacterium]